MTDAVVATQISSLRRSKAESPNQPDRESGDFSIPTPSLLAHPNEAVCSLNYEGVGKEVEQRREQ